MIHLICYLLKNYIRSQKYVAPVIFYIITMLLIYSYKPNPVADSYSVTGMFGRLPSTGEWNMVWSGHLALSLLGLGLSVFFQKSYIPMLSSRMPPFIVLLLLSFVQGSLSGRLSE